jgi:hypothetical protein
MEEFQDAQTKRCANKKMRKQKDAQTKRCANLKGPFHPAGKNRPNCEQFCCITQ